MPRLAQAILWSGVLSMCVGAEAQSSKDYIIAARRTGAIEFIDPATLKTLSSIRVDIAPSTTGLNGVFRGSGWTHDLHRRSNWSECTRRE